MSEPYVEPEAVSDPSELGRVRRLLIAYLLTSTAIFAVSGLLGVALRQSQAYLGEMSPSWFYAVMTAHGLGAFVGWAGFALMGISFWVLSQVGFPMGRRGGQLAWGAFWLMVIGVAGVVVTTLGMRFGASWVFLYPLPFNSTGEWSDLATGLFSASVLLVGLSIVVWCLAILTVVCGPALGARSPRLLNRMGVAMGLGFLWPSRFATVGRTVPYAVIPLTVIAIDMIIATLPLAALLVEMIVQSISPGVTVDPLLAKNVLWWFGHPVVYLLLFPAVSVYYLLIPRYAKRPLVAGNVIAVGWTIAVVANVVVWAHHVYIDYPEGTPQAAINVTMQPLTFALTVVSALSLYSLFLTVFRSRFEWNSASIALFLGMVSWLLSGLSGVVNATIAFDVVVHNTLWIVGHFHHIALLNMGLVIFAAVYAFLPKLLGRPMYSERLAKQHIWLTFFAGTANSVVWMIQGLDGAPRRFAVLPERHDNLSTASLPFVWVLALSQVLFLWNVTQTLRGRVARTERPTLRRPLGDGARPVFTTFDNQVLVVVSSVVLSLAAGLTAWGIGHATRGETAAASDAPAGPDAEIRQVFVGNCGGCHAFARATTQGTVGPALDAVRDRALVIDRVTNGRGTMPAFGGQLSADQIAALADYVSTAGGP